MTEMKSSGYVWLPTSELASIRLRHLVSEKDPTIGVLGDEAGGVTVTGITEWVGTWCNDTLTVGWDWGVLRGAVVILNATEIRTNIQLLAADNNPEAPAVARIHLLEWVESHPWREDAIYNLLEKEDHKGN
jgi:hypothetical protein